MPIDEQTTFEISTRGDVPDGSVDHAIERLTRVGGHCREPVSHVEIRVTSDPNHPGAQAARAEATLDVKHGPVRAHAFAGSVNEAVDEMVDRLRRRLDRHEAKLHRASGKRDAGVAEAGQWRHGDVASAPRQPVPVREAARVVRRKTVATDPMTVEDAVIDLEVLDHDFYLFVDSTTGAAAVVSRAGGGYRLDVDGEVFPPVDEAFGVENGATAAVLDTAAAQRLLDEGIEPFVFHRTAPGAPGQVLYRRFDGNYGVIELHDAS